MTRGSSEDMLREKTEVEPVTISTFPGNGNLETTEQIRGFELLRLAFFALKLRKLEQRHPDENGEQEYEFRRNLLRHAIFQQIVTLTALDARDQAYQLIEACRN